MKKMVDKSESMENIGLFFGAFGIVLAFWSPFAGLASGLVGLHLSKGGSALSRKGRSLSLFAIWASVIVMVLAIAAFYFAPELGATFPVQ